MMRLLFVDDEPRVLQGLMQCLRGKRKIWDMVFVETAKAALEEIERGPFDAVISDMRMPGIDGAELLNRVRRVQPDALRVVLSGQMDEGTAGRAAVSAHRFLAKPCDSETLVGVISQALELRAQLDSPRMRQCIGGMAGLPSLPESCAALNRALEDEGVALRDVAHIVETDVGMAVKVLQLVNSAFFGLSRRIANIDDAVRVLGLTAIRSLVVAQALFQGLAGADATLLRGEQTRSLLAARFAKHFVLDGRQSDVAVTAAFLHNVGRVALMARLPAEHQANCEHARIHGSSAAEAERARLGVTHAEIGAYLLGIWGLPRDVTDAVGCHHAPQETRTALDASAVVYLSEILAAEALGLGPLETTPLPDELLARLGVEKTVAAIRGEIAASPWTPSDEA